VTEILAAGSGVACPAGTTFLSSPDRSELLWSSAHSATHLMGTEVVSWGLKRPEPEYTTPFRADS
jgi:hypothetical protein